MELRADMRAQRRQLSLSERELAAEKLRSIISRCRFFLAAQRVAVYIAVDGEIDPRPIVEQLWAAQRQVFLPVVRPKAGLGFRPYEPDTILKTNQYGIPEPLENGAGELAPRQLDLVLAPVVAFGPDGARLGMGGGYYDRTFAYLKRRTGFRRPFLAGIAYEFQLSNNINAQPWDVRMRRIITDKTVYPKKDER